MSHLSFSHLHTHTLTHTKYVWRIDQTGTVTRSKALIIEKRPFIFNYSTPIITIHRIDIRKTQCRHWSEVNTTYERLAIMLLMDRNTVPCRRFVKNQLPSLKYANPWIQINETRKDKVEKPEMMLRWGQFHASVCTTLSPVLIDGQQPLGIHRQYP